MRNMMRFGMSSILILAVLFGGKLPTATADQSLTTSKMQSTTKEVKESSGALLGTVTMKKNITADVQDLMLIPSGTGQMASFILLIHNNSNQDLSFIDYWANLLSSAGNKYTVQLVDESIDKIPSQSSVSVKFYSQVSRSVKLKDLSVQIIKWDFTTDNYETVLGDVSVPSSYNPTIAAGVKEKVTSFDSDVDISIKQTVISKSDKYNRPNVTVTVENTGRKSVTLPAYQLSVMTPDGLMYPLQTADFTGITLAPLIDKDITLSATIPIEVKNENWKVVVTLPVSDKKLMVPIAIFELDMKTDQSTTTAKGKQYSFSDANGVYYITLDAINRVPLADQDIITSDLTIENKGDTTLPIPAFAGEFLFDDSIKSDASVFVPDKVIAIAPGQSLKIAEMCKLPYTYDPTKIRLTVQEKGTDNAENSDLVTFDSDAHYDAIPSVYTGQSLKINDLGYRSEVALRKTQTFKSSTAKLYAAQVMVTNLEKRYSSIEQLAGYFVNEDGTVYPAVIPAFTDTVMPGGNVILYAYASMPINVNTDNTHLVLGKAITTSKPGPGDTTSELVAGYVDPVDYSLPAEMTAQQELTGIDTYPYTLNISNVGTSIDFAASKVTLTFDYNLQKNLLAKTNLTENDLVLEISDPDNKISFTKKLTIGKDPSTDDLQTGDHSFNNDTWTGTADIYDISLLKKFKLNIYQELSSNQRKLLATQSFDWLVRND